jgi:hypothetical protein
MARFAAGTGQANQVAWARWHLAGLASGIDCRPWSSGVRGAASECLRTAAKREASAAGRLWIMDRAWTSAHRACARARPRCRSVRWRTQAWSSAEVFGNARTARQAPRKIACIDTRVDPCPWPGEAPGLESDTTCSSSRWQRLPTRSSGDRVHPRGSIPVTSTGRSLAKKTPALPSTWSVCSLCHLRGMPGPTRLARSRAR